MTVAVSDTPRLGTEFQLYLSTPATPVDRHIGVISCSMIICNANSKALLLSPVVSAALQEQDEEAA